MTGLYTCTCVGYSGCIQINSIVREREGGRERVCVGVCVCV